MPNASQHHKKAEINRKFLATISIDDFPDWAVVVAFYTAVHVVEELRSACGDGDSTDHEDRLEYIQHKHPTIHTAYHILQNASMLARYWSNAAFFAQFQREQVSELLIGRYLAEIEQYAQERIRSICQAERPPNESAPG